MNRMGNFFWNFLYPVHPGHPVIFLLTALQIRNQEEVVEEAVTVGLFLFEEVHEAVQALADAIVNEPRGPILHSLHVDWVEVNVGDASDVVRFPLAQSLQMLL